MTKLLRKLTRGWGSDEDVALYLDRCQVDTPSAVISSVWDHVAARREQVGKVVDFGAGDGRFARVGTYAQYIGYEIDATRASEDALPPMASLRNQCAFEERINDADLCIGNPPYVRNQDLPTGWRQQAATEILRRTGVAISGLANAWQYFALLGLASTKRDGLVALVIPFEWVARPSAGALRDYIKRNNWGVATYRLRDGTFQGVLTTASITLIDKRDQRGLWEFYEEDADGSYRTLNSLMSPAAEILKYRGRHEPIGRATYVARGLSPGTQKVLTLTESERAHHGLRIGSDVVSCVTSLRPLDLDSTILDARLFLTAYRMSGRKCWLIRTDRRPSKRLSAYLDSVPEINRCTATCRQRDPWWRFSMPKPPAALVASGFRGRRPKAVVNAEGAVAVGSVYGIYGLTEERAEHLVTALSTLDLSGRILSYSRGLKKLEPGQLDTLIQALLASLEKRR